MSANSEYEKNSEILKALGHPVRLQIVEGLINHDECNVNAMVEELELPQSTISQHLNTLKNAGIITPRKDGVKTCYRVIDPRVNEILLILKKGLNISQEKAG
ncbi:MAG: winged helix-turn-helix transcriptional regulator [bacterium]|nr:winged helix-turn-helix transcriptional regulator [bacterium]